MPVQGRYLESHANELMWSRGRSDLDGILTIAREVSESLEVAWRSSDVQQFRASSEPWVEHTNRIFSILIATGYPAPAVIP